jgi:predicted nucleic acid-binding protein
VKPFYIDTSAFYAYLVQNDRYHQPVATCLISAVSEGRALFSSSLVLGEILGLLEFRQGLEAASRFMTDVFPLVLWPWVDAPLFDSLWCLVREKQRRRLRLVDARAVVCIRERPGSVCVAVDDDLRRFEFDVLP